MPIALVVLASGAKPVTSLLPKIQMNAEKDAETQFAEAPNVRKNVRIAVIATTMAPYGRETSCIILLSHARNDQKLRALPTRVMISNTSLFNSESVI
jgi:hypothetical protein